MAQEGIIKAGDPRDAMEMGTWNGALPGHRLFHDRCFRLIEHAVTVELQEAQPRGQAAKPPQTCPRPGQRGAGLRDSHSRCAPHESACGAGGALAATIPRARSPPRAPPPRLRPGGLQGRGFGCWLCSAEEGAGRGASDRPRHARGGGAVRKGGRELGPFPDPGTNSPRPRPGSWTLVHHTLSPVAFCTHSHDQAPRNPA